MLTASQSANELQTRRIKLANSYAALYEEFGSKELRTVGNYKLGNLIGKGSFGKVYLATHQLTHGSKVVLKSAKKDDANLAREIHHHRQFLHPHIARLYEVIVTENLVWLSLEYCPGDELYHYLTKHGPLPPPMVQRIFTQIVGAVSYVHSKHCVHRDLKLENILLDKNENVKLCDFGFTREYEGKASYLQTWCGTVCYSAPEMLKGEKYAGEKVDVWSLGIILYALLSGELPFDEDDENETKGKILKEEPRYPTNMPAQGKELINLLLSKRPLLRPSLADILQHPWLAEHAPQQQAILKLQQPAPFTTQLEKDTLQRMRSAGVDIDTVIENVLSQRCDSLAGWWALLIEKEERRARRRERKRKEKENEAKALRRVSAASARLERIAPTIKEADEEGLGLSDVRGREAHRRSGGPSFSLDLVPEAAAVSKTPTTPKTPLKTPHLDRRPGRTASNPRRRSQLGTRDNIKRNSGLSVLAANPDLIATDASPQKRKRRYQQPFMSQLASLKHWFKESAKRGKSPNETRDGANHRAADPSARLVPRPTQIYTDTRPPGTSKSAPQVETPPQSFTSRPRVATNNSSGSGRHLSRSPAPLTPSSSYRRSKSSALRGRKSTSSSVSSMRSLHAHHHSQSIASSTSSNSVASPSLSVRNTPVSRRASPNLSSVKVLPKTPLESRFPSDIRVVRGPPGLNLTNATSPFTGLGPPSPGLMFAKRKRTPFKGPMLGPGTASRRRSNASVASQGSRAGSVQGRKSGEVIQEEEEDEEDEIEEVDAFSPIESPESADGLFLNDASGDHAPSAGLASESRRAPLLQEETLKALERLSG